MKNLFKLGLGLLLFAITFTTQAQTTAPITFGIKAGANLMMGGKFEVGGTEYTSKFVPGFQGGFFAEIPLTTKISFMPEVLYAQKGAKLDETVAGTNGVIKSTAGYIDVPILFAYNATPELHFMLGPQASFLLDQTTRTYVNGTKISTSTDKEDFRKAIAGGVVGVGYRVTPKMNLNLRYNMDFQSISNDDINQDKSRFSGFALSAGYSF